MAQTGMASGEVFTNNYAAWGGGLWQVSGADGTVYWQANNRYADGSAKNTAVGGHVSSRSVDGFGRTAGISTDGNVQSGTYVFDSLGNLTSRSDPLNTLTAESYQYDALNRVTGRNGAPDTGYDALGNITVANSRAYAYSSGTQRLASVSGSGFNNSYSYDNNGNVVTDGSRTISYTAWNLPWQATRGAASLAWDYDHAHSRVIERSSAHGTTFYAPGYEKVVPIESTATNPRTIERTYIPTPDGVVGVITRSATGNAGSAETVTAKTEYWHKDALGSIVAITDQSGNLVQRFRFDAWGNRVCLNAAGTAVACSADAVSGTEERGFAGHETLEEVGLVHMNGRLYDPAIGRMLQADPTISNPSNGQNYNRYSYVLNNPLSLTDPTGFSPWSRARDQWVKPIAAAVAAYFIAPWVAGEIVGASQSAAYSAEIAGGSSVAEAASVGQAAGVAATPAANFAGGAVAGATANGIQGGNVQSAFFAALAGGIGNYMSGGAYFGSPIEQISNFGRAIAGAQFTDATQILMRAVMQRQMMRIGAKIARRFGLTSDQMDIVLMSLSMAGNEILTGPESEIHGGSRFVTDDARFKQTNGVGVLGFGNRGVVGYPFDVVDSILAYQGKPTASLRDFAYSGLRGAEIGGHSLGAADALNAQGYGLTPRAHVVSVPLGNVATPGAVVTLGGGDLVNGFYGGMILNLSARICNVGAFNHSLESYRAAGCN